MRHHDLSAAEIIASMRGRTAWAAAAGWRDPAAVARSYPGADRCQGRRGGTRAFPVDRRTGLCLPDGQLARRPGNATVLVTGETGCIGSALIKQLAARGAGRIVSVSRGATSNWPRCAVAEYRYGRCQGPRRHGQADRRGPAWP